MSNLTIASLRRIDRDQLYGLLKTSSTMLTGSSPQVAVIDVRDSDHVGGHIRHSRHVPSSTLDWATPELVRALRDVPTVVFHCALSQQRGPSAALRYLRERARLLGEEEGEGESVGVRADGSVGAEAEAGVEGGQKQQVCVLDGGFVQWQEKYGEDSTVTEGYVKDIWEFGY
ncbi:uncharacterized protein K452DRAFT_290581 [Aplosporella prunicola CBS 121167]|uniref:Rhodanese domain-containing protein n=1 Tax=Aplosporella prunicola CBS 121167 TaxID=1176127 RepID=A0A6A6B2M1_9PEZI|nr:uncharacterized protein K452DRAFT_290581 [Aplosporella prunicola CBS 121167]KAF2138439.1 hypothetical protein K452DRAFT_290581 [Aplosporella prunicola CBS 121167]